MNKIFALFIAAVSLTSQLPGAQIKHHAKHQKISVQIANSLSVTTPQELIDAIEVAAVNPKKSTTIKIKGVIIGNFEIPATVHSITLLGTTQDAAISANNSGTALTIALGATVKLKNLTITQGSSIGIINLGNLDVTSCAIIANGEEGISSYGHLHIKDSLVSEHRDEGLYIQTGGYAKIEHCLITQNGYGILADTAEIVIRKSIITENVSYGIYNYYGTKCNIDNCEVSQNDYGLYNSYSSLVTIKDSKFTGQSNDGIYNEGTFMRIEKSDLSNNLGCGIFNYDYAEAHLDECSVNNNRLSGANNEYYAAMRANKTQFHSNASESSGGAIYNTTQSNLEVKNCSIKYNSASIGGAIYNDFLCLIEDSKINHNVATASGGAVYNTGYGELVIRNSIVRENTANEDAGGIYSAGLATIINSKIEKNTAANGGGLANIEGVMSVITSKVKKNQATNGVGSGGGIYSPGASLSVVNSDVSDNIPDQIVE